MDKVQKPNNSGMTSLRVYTQGHSISATHQSIACYIRLEALEGFLDSPNYPDSYPPGFDCCYDIARSSSSHCGVKFYGAYLSYICIFVHS
jgi:hypothetical protein